MMATLAFNELISKHLKYYLNTSKVGMDTIFLLKSHLIDYLQIILFPPTQPSNQ